MQRQSHFKSAKILGGALFISAFLTGCGGDAKTTPDPAPTLAPPVSDFTITPSNAPVLARQVAQTLDGLRNNDGGLAPAILSVLATASTAQFNATANGANPALILGVNTHTFNCNGGGTLTGTITLTGNVRYPGKGNKYELEATNCVDYVGATYKSNGKISMSIDGMEIQVANQESIDLTKQSPPLNKFFGYKEKDVVANIPVDRYAPLAFSSPNFTMIMEFLFATTIKLDTYKIEPNTAGAAPSRTYNGTFYAGFSQFGQMNIQNVPSTNMDLNNNPKNCINCSALTVDDGTSQQTIDSFQFTSPKHPNTQAGSTVLGPISFITAIYNLTGKTSAKTTDGAEVGSFAVGMQTQQPPFYSLFGNGNNQSTKILEGGFLLKTSNKSNMTLTGSFDRLLKIYYQQLDVDQDGNGKFENTKILKNTLTNANITL